MNDFYFNKDKHEGYKKNPEGYLFRVVSNANIQWHKYSNKVDMDIELPDNSYNPEFDEIKDSIRKIVEFSERVRSDAFLTKKELEKMVAIAPKINKEMINDLPNVIIKTNPRTKTYAFNLITLKFIHFNIIGSNKWIVFY